MEDAAKRAGKTPKVVITDKLHAYLDGIELAFGADTEHIQSSPFKVAEHTQKIERFHGTLKARTKVMRGLKNIETAHDFTSGWLVHYNCLRPHEALDDKTPAEAASVDYPYKNWADITRRHIPSIKVEVTHTPRGSIRLPTTHVGRPRKHVRARKPRGDIYVGHGMISRHPFSGGKPRKGRLI